MLQELRLKYFRFHIPCAGAKPFILDEANIYQVAVKIAENSECNISRIEKTYDSINVEVSKILDFSIIDKFGFDGSVIYSSSSAKIIYPWDEEWDNCKNFKFEY